MRVQCVYKATYKRVISFEGGTVNACRFHYVREKLAGTRKNAKYYITFESLIAVCANVSIIIAILIIKEM